MSTATIEIKESHIREILRYLSFGLVKGLGEPIEGKMCVEHVISVVFGKSNSDTPDCVGEEVRKPKISLNDCNWSSNQARAKGMEKIAIAQLGSINLNQDEFKLKLKLNSTKRILPYLIQKHYDTLKEKDSKLLEYKDKFESLTSLDDAMWKEFYYYYNYYYNYNYYYYYNYNYYNYYNYYYNYYGDEFLTLIADTILQTLQEMNCEGCKWLYLLDEKK